MLYRAAYSLADSRLAIATGNSKSCLVCEALGAFISSEEEFILAVEEGRAAARSGQLIEHDEVARTIDELLASDR